MRADKIHDRRHYSRWIVPDYDPLRHRIVDVMKRIAPLMLGGMVTASIFSMFIVPAVYLIWQKWKGGFSK